VSAGDATAGQGGNVEIMRRFVNYMADAGLGAETDKILSYLHPEIEWYPGMIPLDQEVYRGHDGYREHAEQVRAHGTEASYLNVDEIRAVGGDLVLALGWVHYEGKEAPTFDSEYAMLARFEDGLIRELRSFLSRAEAERAASDA
jgi:ketosteroid isomerase-like protein